MLRRDLLGGAAGFLAGLQAARGAGFDLEAFERPRVLAAADRYLSQEPLTVTAASSPRSAGGPHDFFSEGDYWWPDPDHPGGPYIQRDGMTNPANFTRHREFMVRLSLIVPALAAAWRLTKDKKYSLHAARHLRAWFVDPATRMNPSLLYAQAIHGRVTGRGIGIIDTLHLVEVARAVPFLDLSAADRAAVVDWFAGYLRWMTTHEYGKAERDAANNHGTAWTAQAAAFARLTANREVTAWCIDRFKSVLLPSQMAPDGSFPLELKRTKPYGYSLFNLDVMSILVQTLSTDRDNLWTFALPDGRGMARGLVYMYPYMLDKKKWPLKPDVMYYDQWPVAQPCLLFAGLALDRPEYIDLWRRLDHDPTVEEVLRNWLVRQPVLRV